MSALSGKVQTVLGPIEPDQLGRTMTHEHLTMTFECCYFPPAPGDETNLLLLQETSAVREELHEYRKEGGGTIVENTTQGIARDLPCLKQLAKDTGVHIIGGAGYYVDATHSEATRKMTVEKLTDIIISEVLHGADGTEIRCGVIGEIGCSWPITDSEKKVLQATAHAQTELGCPVIIHPGRNPGAPAEIVRLLQEAGGDISKTVMTIFDNGDLLEFAKMGSYLEYDLFGSEMLNYAYNLEVDMPSDSQRYGGHGYSHILKNIVPKMLIRGINQTQVDKILIDNPKRWLTFK
ncbi:unnamed protein product, partial [Coregonus sp. 'balchen']